MPIIYRAEKGSPLSIEELDNNFKDLDSRLKILEDNPDRGEGLGKIQIRENQATFIGSFGTDFGTFTLPTASFKPRGSWHPKTTYQTLDLVTMEMAVYSCLKDHTSLSWDQDRSLWQEVLSLPKPSSSSLPLYEKATLPTQESIGKLAALITDGGAIPIFFNGEAWQYLVKGETV